MYATAVTPNVGYTVGASGALSAVSAALIVDQRKIPPHATYSEPDIACKLGIAQAPLRGPHRRRGDGGLRGARSERRPDPDAAPGRSRRRTAAAGQLR